MMRGRWIKVCTRISKRCRHPKRSPLLGCPLAAALPSRPAAAAAARGETPVTSPTRAPHPTTRDGERASGSQAMANKRQREARKRFREANPGLFPANPTPPADGTKKTKKKNKNNKKSMFKKTSKAGVGGAGRSKHPLRVPGMRPGERCFICKATDHVAKVCPEKSLWDKNKICLLCRQRGHSLKNCPDKNDENLKKFCYNCGESGHSLSKCPKPIENGGTKFASCFVCKQQGHLSKNCPENKHGIYPKGGCCKICGEVTHLAKHCPNKGRQDLITSWDDAFNTEEHHLEDNAVLRGGDDLDDDFIEEETKPTKAKKAKQSSSKSTTGTGDGDKNTNAKAKVKQAPKVVKFFG